MVAENPNVAGLKNCYSEWAIRLKKKLPEPV
jgi:hypothetical protein